MFEKYISLKSIENATSFCNAVRNIDADVDVVSGRYVIDAKSIMGLFSIDLSRKVKIVSHTEDKEVLAKLEEIVSKYDED